MSPIAHGFTGPSFWATPTPDSTITYTRPSTRAQKRSRVNVAGDACNRHVSTANSPGLSDATPIKDRAPTPEFQGGAAEPEVPVPAEQAIPAIADIWTALFPDSYREDPPPMPEIARYIEEVIDRGKGPDPQIHLRIKGSMWKHGSRVSFARYPEMVSNILTVRLPDMHHLDTVRVTGTVVRYIMSLMDSIVSQCGPLASEFAKLDGLQNLIQIGWALIPGDGRPSRDFWIEFDDSEVFLTLRSSMHMIIAGMQIGDPAPLAYCGEELVLKVEKLNRRIERVWGGAASLKSILHLLRSHMDIYFTDPGVFNRYNNSFTPDSEIPFPRPWSDDASPKTGELRSHSPEDELV
ncbi:hypothetical protein BO99DRAFT_477325 [Aspergillus violaceofuscus CBS 115571]|uniref:Uncharacterized protein n=1 Tax=Aspergillus violaceofuscus (strain CBS 115571) TaxID=1450538 RepID=A0A2V5I335_ASPV1|nr:hypothetical protein BO99DRAFT_477325 [Aspergillus violaceofuscus CBS 115571]